MQYTEKDVAQLIANVEEAFTAELVKTKESTLSKSEHDEEDHKDKEEHEKPEHEEAPKHESKGDEHEEHEEGKENHEEEGHDYDEEDMAHMEKMYRSMSKGEQKAHSDCLTKCMGKSESEGMSKAEITSSKPGKTPGAKSAASKAQGDQMSKSDGNGGEMSECQPKDVPGAKSEASKEQDKISTEMTKTETGKIEASAPGKIPGAKSEASKAHGDQMEKSENTEIELLKSELAAEKAEKQDLKKNFEAVQEFLTKFAKKVVPQGKAITSLDVIAKSDTSEEKSLTKNEIHEILKSKTADPSLKKSDRDAINSFYLTGQVNTNGISHLLK